MASFPRALHETGEALTGGFISSCPELRSSWRWGSYRTFEDNVQYKRWKGKEEEIGEEEGRHMEWSFGAVWRSMVQGPFILWLYKSHPRLSFLEFQHLAGHCNWARGLLNKEDIEPMVGQTGSAQVVPSQIPSAPTLTSMQLRCWQWEWQFKKFKWVCQRRMWERARRLKDWGWREPLRDFETGMAVESSCSRKQGSGKLRVQEGTSQWR